ncbi:MAG: TonB-dependent receptor [Bacteroidota bacterium]
MKAPIVIWLVFSSVILLGQEQGSVTGTVRDADGGEPMIAVNISANRKSGTISETKGEFTLQLPAGTHLVEFYYVGYERVSREVRLTGGEVVRLDVEMEVSSEMLDEVVVSAGKFEQKLSDLTVSMEVLKSRQLSNQNITSLDQMLEKTSGISILNGQPSIRGGSGFSYGVGSRVLMLVDDMPMISGDAGDIKWSFMPVENVNQVEIIKGASSVLYGSSALNGVINLRTRFPGNEPQTEVALFSGAFLEPRREEMVWWKNNPSFAGASFSRLRKRFPEMNPLFAGVSLSHLRKIGNLDLTLGGNYFRDEGYRELEHEQRIRGNLGLRYKFEKVKGLSAGVNTSAMYTDHADFIFWQDADSGAYRQNPDSYARLFGHRFNIDPYVEYYAPDGDRHSLRTRLYSVGNGTIDETKNSFSKVWYGEYRYLNRIGEKIHWTSGVSFMRNTVVAGLFNEHNGSNSGIYSQLDAQVLPRLKLSTGLRWEFNTLNGELFFSKPVMRAGLNYQPGKATYLRASFGQGYRFPSVAEMFVDASFDNFKIFPNPDLQPENGWSAEVGIKQGFAFGSWTGFADLALFWTQYEDMIEYNFGYFPPENPVPPYSDYVGYKALNIENARIIGTEASFTVRGKLGPFDLSLTEGITVMDPVDPLMLDTIPRSETDDYILKYRRRIMDKSDLEVEFRKWFVGVNMQFNSRMIRVDEAFIDPILGDALMPGFPGYWENEAGGYTLIDLRLGWNVSPLFRINLLLKNANNVEYLGRPGDIGPPRNVTLQAKVTF